MVERLKGADALALLEENVGSVMGEIPINGKIAEVEFRVPVGEEATALQEDVVGFVLKIEAGGTEEHNLKHAVPAWTVINKWGHKLMVTHGVPLTQVFSDRVMRAIGMQGSMALLGELAGLRAKSVDHLSSDRSGGRPAPE